jgi:putative transposase
VGAALPANPRCQTRWSSALSGDASHHERHFLRPAHGLCLGCAWRYLPSEYGPWPTVYYYLRRWCLDGTWEQIHTHLREVARLQAGRDPTPSAASVAILDSQSVKTTEQGGPHGFDGAKKINGRKRHLLVDTEGLVLKAVVHPANLHDRLGAKLVLGALGTAFPRLHHIWADQGYSGALGEWSHEQLGIDLVTISKPNKQW